MNITKRHKKIIIELINEKLKGLPDIKEPIFKEPISVSPYLLKRINKALRFRQKLIGLREAIEQ